MSYRLINANSIVYNSDAYITAENIQKMPCIYADLPNGMDGKHYNLQEPKTGHWIINEDEENTVHGNCSVCGWEAHYYEDDIIGMPYCPNCGAKMVEPQESEE